MSEINKACRSTGKDSLYDQIIKRPSAKLKQAGSSCLTCTTVTCGIGAMAGLVFVGGISTCAVAIPLIAMNKCCGDGPTAAGG